MNVFVQRVLDYPGFLWDTIRSPLRIRNVISRFSETLVALGAFYYFGMSWLAVLYALLIEFAWYEFFLEPAGLAGHYFERGPRTGEKFRYE